MLEEVEVDGSNVDDEVEGGFKTAFPPWPSLACQYATPASRCRRWPRR